jgi:hypothetical protein
MATAFIASRLSLVFRTEEQKIMRILLWVGALAMLSACTATPNVEPRQYLDELTAATITAVPEPWIFHREGTTPQLDFVHLYAVDVNRMGEHRQYVVVVKHWPATDLASDPIPALEVNAQGQQVRLDAVAATARELGVGETLDSSAPKGAKFWFYPIEQADLETIARSPEVKLALAHSDVRASYIVWSDGHVAFQELSRALAEIPRINR